MLKMSVGQSEMSYDIVDHHSLPVIEPVLWARC